MMRTVALLYLLWQLPVRWMFWMLIGVTAVDVIFWFFKLNHEH